MNRVLIILSLLLVANILRASKKNNLVLDSNILVIECREDILFAEKLEKIDYEAVHLHVFEDLASEKVTLNKIFNRILNLQKLRILFYSKIKLSDIEFNFNNVKSLEIYYLKDPSQISSYICKLDELKVIKFIQCKIINFNYVLDSINNVRGNLKGIQFYDCNIANNDLGSLNKLNLNWISISDSKIVSLSCELLNNQNLEDIYIISAPLLDLNKCAKFTELHCINILSYDKRFKSKNRLVLRKLKRKCRRNSKIS